MIESSLSWCIYWIWQSFSCVRPSQGKPGCGRMICANQGNSKITCTRSKFEFDVWFSIDCQARNRCINNVWSLGWPSDYGCACHVCAPHTSLPVTVIGHHSDRSCAHQRPICLTAAVHQLIPLNFMFRRNGWLARQKFCQNSSHQFRRNLTAEFGRNGWLEFRPNRWLSERKLNKFQWNPSNFCRHSISRYVLGTVSHTASYCDRSKACMTASWSPRKCWQDFVRNFIGISSEPATHSAVKCWQKCWWNFRRASLPFCRKCWWNFHQASHPFHQNFSYPFHC